MSVAMRTAGLILRNDLRSAWRSFLGGRWQSWTSVALLALVQLVAHGVAAWLLSRVGEPAATVEVLVWAFLGFLMMGGAMAQAIGLLFERADFDLLFSAPIRPGGVLLARLAGMAVNAMLGAGLLFLPVLNGLILNGHLRYLAAYPVWAALAVASAALGIIVALGLVRVLGVRRARVLVQVLGALMGAAIYLGSQGSRFLPATLAAGLIDGWAQVSAHPLAQLPVRAGRGELGAFALLLAGAGVVAGLAVAAMAQTFLRGAQEAAGTAPRSRAGSRPYRWREGLRAVTFWKELRLLRRDPLLVAQVLPSVLYLIPALVGGWRLGMTETLAGVAVVIAGQLASVLATVCAAGEEGWDLIRASPAPELRMRLSKLAAALAAPGLVVVVLGGVLAFLGRPVLALLVVVTALGVGAATAWLQVTSIRPSPRKDVLRRRGGRSVGRSIASGILMVVATVGIGLLAHESWWLGGAVTAIAWLGVVACFTFVEVEEVRFPEAEAARS